INV
ncbi:hypothetical protein D018_0179B, partial [Vibrio parahaemolyticus VP2007-007]